ncbi:MAG: methylenetetrahydrofolate reductase [NAD(P)H] [Phycisphaerales bacterium]|jgi:methylenetetrahydrofolate reductase (NADPH)
MHFADIFSGRTPSFSFEFFPPKSSDAAGDLFTTISELQPLNPSFVSVTYGAGGSTRELTNDLVVKLRTETKLNPAPHLTCVNHDERDIESILHRYAQAGIRNIVALRGDTPKDASSHDNPWRSFRYASELVRFIKRTTERLQHSDRRGFGVAVAGYPEGHAETPNRLTEIELLKAKVDEGADVIITQLFFDNRDFYDFRSRCEIAGIRVPIVAGIMPISTMAGVKRMAELASGTRFPAPLLRAIARAGNDDAVRRLGIHWATEQCRDLLENNVAGVHFYTLNRSKATREIYHTLSL